MRKLKGRKEEVHEAGPQVVFSSLMVRKVRNVAGKTR